MSIIEPVAPVFSASRIAEILTPSGQEPLTPTDEQRAVIEHRLAGSTLVIAGAGSGKTETMANRVVWLIANGIVDPEQVLGLTFTRKAAGELRERIVRSLTGFSATLENLAELGQLSEAERERAVALRAVLADGLDLPEVSTYNSFAAGVLQEFGVAAGLAPGAVVIDEAMAWRVARETLYASNDPDLVTSDLSASTLIRHMIQMDRMVSDHLTSFDRVDQVVDEFRSVLRLPYNEKEKPEAPSGKVYAPVRDAVQALAETPLITRLARLYSAEKQRRGLIDFSDQLSLATQTLVAAPESRGVLRARYRAVLLDEVQDTSVGQTRLLSSIFAGKPVMAVGDPHQSIYAWRGASAEGLLSFHEDFRGRAEAGESAARSTTLTLSVSWRNPVKVLQAANIISEELRIHSKIRVPELQARPGAIEGRVDCVFPETVHEERVQLAQWMADARKAFQPRDGDALPTAAVILRSRSAMPAISAALTEAGVPNRIVGLGGLLSTPEVTDVVSVLRCLWYADAGSDLIRVLAGPRFRIGVSDLAGLRDAARWFSQRDVAQQRLQDEDREADSVLPDPDRQFTLIDALDAIASMSDLGHRALAAISVTGRERLQQAGQMLRSLRRGVGGDIADLIGSVVFALRLDIELEANEAKLEHGTGSALANIEAFTDLAEGFLAIDSQGTLAALLEWIERAAEDDDAPEHVPAPLPGTVQLITAHGAKGLQWDLVAVPRLVNDEFPGKPRSGKGWLTTGALPDELRGDRNARPQLNWRIASTQKELRDRIAEYREALQERHADEERRLAYVAVTRSAGWLFVSGSFWGGQKRPRSPSTYLAELAAGESPVIPPLPQASMYDEDPSEMLELTAEWPLDPLGRRGETVLRAAGAVREALEQPGHARALSGSHTDKVIELLLAERNAQTTHTAHTERSGHHALRSSLPERVTASTFHEFVENPAQAELRRLRPIPQRPYRRTRVGNQFHEWVERRSTTAGGSALPLAGLDPEEWGIEAHEFDGETDLQPLIEAFERSRWSGLQPVAVELEVSLPFAGRTLVCKLDAVYRVEGEPERYEVVDWKSGRAPINEAEKASRFFQLDLYRHAYALWADVSPESIDVSLFYVAEETELRGEGSRSLAELEAAWLAAAETLRSEADGGDRSRL